MCSGHFNVSYFRIQCMFQNREGSEPAKPQQMHVLASSAALKRKEVSGLSAFSPHLKQHLGSRTDINTDLRPGPNKHLEILSHAVTFFICSSVNFFFHQLQVESYGSAIIYLQSTSVPLCVCKASCRCDIAYPTICYIRLIHWHF